MSEPITATDLSALRVELVDRMQRLEFDVKTQLLDLKTEVRALRNSMRLQIVVPALTLIVSLVIHYIFR
jgi:hypothetical protein